jgi:hypothetical protein
MKSQVPGAAPRGAGGTRRDAGGKATHEADADVAGRRARARRGAWLLGGLALAFYLGYMVLMYVQGPGGG